MDSLPDFAVQVQDLLSSSPAPAQIESWARFRKGLVDEYSATQLGFIETRFRDGKNFVIFIGLGPAIKALDLKKV